MKLPASYYNLVSYIGVTIASLSFSLIVFMMIVTSFMEDTTPYLGIIIFIVLPVLLLIELAMIPIGMWRKTRIAKKNEEELIRTRLILNLNNRRHRNAAMVFLFGTFIFVLLTGVGSYELYHYSESVEFCGTVCHEAMKPEYVAYQKSPHAKVTCAQCHIGSGAEWFVKAKISGMYQVYSVLTNKVPRPIETPIANLRPARETCEECHWPQKFYSQSIKTEKYYLTDEQNTDWKVQLKMRTGPSHSSQGLEEGIHWHINPNIQIDYISSDHKREIIPWVRKIDKLTGDTTIFNDAFEPLDIAAIDSLEMRTMDCMDCHNRPSHNYLTPATFVNNAMAAGAVSPSLPGIKSLAMQIFVEEFTSTDSALNYIEKTVWDFYVENYPDVIKEKKKLVENAIVGLQDGFSKNMFPEMKANWDAYPDHIGHMEFNGCFRCHNDTHEAETGEVIIKDCALCHDIMQQGNKDTLMVAPFNESLEFMHPVDIDGAWQEANCSECHRYLY